MKFCLKLEIKIDARHFRIFRLREAFKTIFPIFPASRHLRVCSSKRKQEVVVVGGGGGGWRTPTLYASSSLLWWGGLFEG